MPNQIPTLQLEGYFRSRAFGRLTTRRPTCCTRTSRSPRARNRVVPADAMQRLAKKLVPPSLDEGFGRVKVVV